MKLITGALNRSFQYPKAENAEILKNENEGMQGKQKSRSNLQARADHSEILNNVMKECTGSKNKEAICIELRKDASAARYFVADRYRLLRARFDALLSIVTVGLARPRNNINCTH